MQGQIISVFAKAEKVDLACGASVWVAPLGRSAMNRVVLAANPVGVMDPDGLLLTEWLTRRSVVKLVGEVRGRDGHVVVSVPLSGQEGADAACYVQDALIGTVLRSDIFDAMTHEDLLRISSIALKGSLTEEQQKNLLGPVGGSTGNGGSENASLPSDG